MNGKTWALVLPLGLALVFVGASAAAGHAIRGKLAEQSAQAKAALPAGAFEERMDRGLFSTTRTLTFHLGCPPHGAGQAVAPLTFLWRDVIQHGPLPAFSSVGLAEIASSLELPKAFAEHMQVEGGGQWGLTAHTHVGLRGDFNSKLSAPAVKLAAGSDALSFSALDARITGRMPYLAGPLSYRGSFAPIDLQQTSADSAFHVTLGRSEVQGQVQLVPARSGFFMPMHGHGHMTHMLVRGTAASAAGGLPSELRMGLNDVGFTHAVEQDKGLWSMQSSLRASSEVLGFKLDKLEMSGTLRRLHEPSYLKLARALVSMSTRCDAGADKPDPSEMLEKLQGDIVALLSHDPEYAMGPLAVEIGGKRAELSYRLGTRGITAQDTQQPLAALLLSKSVGHAEAAVDLALVDTLAQRVLGQTGLQPASAQLPAAARNSAASAIMARAMIDGFVSEGYLVRDGARIKATLDSVGERITLNGKPFSLSDVIAAEPDTGSEPSE